MRPRKEGQTGFKVHEPDNVDLAETPEQSQVAMDEVILQAFRMSEPIFPKTSQSSTQSRIQDDRCRSKEPQSLASTY